MTGRPLHPAVMARLHSRLEELGTISEEPGRLTRRIFSPALDSVHHRFHAWADAAGLQFSVDALQNMRIRWPQPHVSRSPATETPGAVLVVGSHLDTVRDAGRFDGTLGVVAGLTCVEQLQAWGVTLPFDLEVVGFSDEEGLRFQTAYLGSSYYAGVFRPEWLSLRDDSGQSLAQLLESRGTDPSIVTSTPTVPTQVIGYLELHIEQGPQLETLGIPVAVVSAIAAQTRARLRFIGSAGHAGTTPMRLRKDALCAAAEAILEIEGQARKVEGLRATVGQIRIEPGASNVIPERVTLSLDIRHEKDHCLQEALAELKVQVDRKAADRGITVDWEWAQQGPSVPMAPALRAHLQQAAESRQGPTPHLASGAGHDAAIMARLGPTGMLVVRCRDGLSHHPAEWASPEDIEVGVAVLVDAIVALGNAHSNRHSA